MTRTTDTGRRVQRPPNWLKAVYAAIAGLVAMVTLIAVFAPAPDRAGPSIPRCEKEDGSTQQVCLFEGDNGFTYLNYDYGKGSAVLPE